MSSHLQSSHIRLRSMRADDIPQVANLYKLSFAYHGQQVSL